MTALELVPAAPSELERSDDPAAAVLAYCESATAYLARALVAMDVPDVREVRDQAKLLEVLARERDLGRQAELAAREVVRRANLELGRLIRQGQAEGRVETLEQARSRGGRDRQLLGDAKKLPKPTDFATSDELSREIFPMADAPPGVAEAAIEQAKAEGNLSRANVVRKLKPDPGPAAPPDPEEQPDSAPAAPETGGGATQVPASRRIGQITALADKGLTSEQIGREIGVSRKRVVKIAKDNGIEISADKLFGRTRKKVVDHTRMVEQTVIDLEVLTSALDLLDISAIDPDADTGWWVRSLKSSLRSIDRALIKPLKQLEQEKGN